ncbi:hypothetical protein Patl1_33881 [Pistacia atlantica]|uniref:Uncharacterized protein n=1 Tax=Pistacia atlantica TaxID=434234 RepID=A0ACC0ZUV6_9ROSI|nr:hypothetical protein Patl1_33881 [Pistacia atlantica]
MCMLLGHPEGQLTSETWDFIKNVSVDVQSLPRVLLMHIPLYRRDWTPCGPHRNSPVINQRILRTGPGQPNTVPKLHHRGIIKPLTGLDQTCGTKEKNEDELCEYEMIWDVEGSMHLIKKPIRYAVMRSTARKNVSQEIEVCKNMDMSVDDPTTKLPPKTSKSKTNFIITRLVRTFRMLTFIAAVNISLYMMLLFKDWIDI